MMKASQKKEILPDNLSLPPSTLLEGEMDEVKRLLASHRFVTLTDAGGSGERTP